MITRAQWLGPYAAHPAARAVRLLANGDALLAAVNRMLDVAASAGVSLTENPTTHSLVSGSGNGGFRPPDCPVGAPLSQHKNGNALDVYDPDRALMRWLLAERRRLFDLGLWLEHPQWCATWVHCQSVPPAGWTPDTPRRVFVPYADLARYPTTCAALPEQAAAQVAPFPFCPPAHNKL